jgi:hypothetical protein
MQNGATQIKANAADLFLYGQKAVSSLTSYIQLGAEIQIVPQSNRDTRIYGRGLRINTNSTINSTDERLSVNGKTLLKGANTLSTSSALQIYDGDGTPNLLWDFKNNGNANIRDGSILLGRLGISKASSSVSINPIFALTVIGETTDATKGVICCRDSSGADVFTISNEGKVFIEDDTSINTGSLNVGNTNLEGFWKMGVRSNTPLVLKDSSNVKLVSFAFDGNRFAQKTKFGQDSSPTSMVDIVGENTSGSSSALKVMDSSSTSLWDFRNNGDIYAGSDSVVYLSTNDLKINTGTTGKFVVNATSTTTNDAFIVQHKGSSSFILDANGKIQNTNIVGSHVIDMTNSANTAGIILRSFDFSTIYSPQILIRKSLSHSNGVRIVTGSTSEETKWQRTSSSNYVHQIKSGTTANIVNLFKLGWSNSQGFIVGSGAKIGSENISLQSHTAIKGENTLSTASALQIYDGDSTPNKLWDFRNNGDIIANQNINVAGTTFAVATFNFLRPVGAVNYGAGYNLSLYNSSNVSTIYARFGVAIENVTAGSETGRIDLKVADNGTLTTKLSVKNTSIVSAVDLDMSNKKVINALINPNVQEIAHISTFTINADRQSDGVLTAMSGATIIATPSGTPVQSQSLVFRFKDDGTARAITWSAIFRAIGVTLPTTTTASKLLYVGCKYNSTDTKWDVVSVQEET